MRWLNATAQPAAPPTSTGTAAPESKFHVARCTRHRRNTAAPLLHTETAHARPLRSAGRDSAGRVHCRLARHPAKLAADRSASGWQPHQPGPVPGREAGSSLPGSCGTAQRGRMAMNWSGFHPEANIAGGEIEPDAPLVPVAGPPGQHGPTAPGGEDRAIAKAGANAQPRCPGHPLQGSRRYATVTPAFARRPPPARLPLPPPERPAGVQKQLSPRRQREPATGCCGQRAAGYRSRWQASRQQARQPGQAPPIRSQSGSTATTL